MLNSDILRRIRYAFNFDDRLMLEIFTMGGILMDVEALKNHLKKEEDAGYVPLGTRTLTAFLDGLILRKRGARKTTESAPVPAVKESFSNNMVLRKIKIALEFKEEDLLEVLKRSDMEISRAELSALFRKKDHKNYKVCGDQLLRNFLAGLAGYKRPLPVEPQNKVSQTKEPQIKAAPIKDTKAREDKAGVAKSQPKNAEYPKNNQGKINQDKVLQGNAKQDNAKQDNAKQDNAKQDNAKQDKAKQDKVQGTKAPKRKVEEARPSKIIRRSGA